MSHTPDFEFLTTKLLNLLDRHRSGMLIEEIVSALNRPRSSIRNTLFKLRAQGCVEMSYIAQYTYLYKFICHPDRDGRPIDATPASIINMPKFCRPVETPRVMIRDTIRRKRKPSQSGTGIITPPREPQPFKPLVRRDFYEAQRLAELTR